jgi:hypothetical protein
LNPRAQDDHGQTQKQKAGSHDVREDAQVRTGGVGEQVNDEEQKESEEGAGRKNRACQTQPVAEQARFRSVAGFVAHVEARKRRVPR